MLEARNIGFAYPRQEALYTDLSLHLSPGERVALIAPSGWGKTTLCRLLAGYAEPHGGTILVDGKPLPTHGVCPVQLVGQHPEKAFDPRRRLGFSLTEGRVPLRETNDAKGRDASPERNTDTQSERGTGAHGETGAARTDTENAAMRLRKRKCPPAPEEYLAFLQKELGIEPEWLKRFPHELSGGELQRCCLARALAAQPRYLIADEITTMLDALSQARIWHVLASECERRNIGLAFVSHSPELIERIATRCIVLA